MLFSSITFLYFFLPVFLLCYACTPPRGKNLALLAFSLFFYFWGEPIYTFLLLGVTGCSFVCGRMIHKNGRTRSRGSLAVSVAVSLLTLMFFKYADFLIGICNGLFNTQVPPLKLPLPLGISFYVFQTISYTVDVYRGDAGAQKKLLPYAAYATMFPQLLAGPIVRYTTVADELKGRRHTLEDVGQGMFRFVVGLAKKVLIANQLGELNRIAHGSAEGSVMMAWLAAVCFTLQVYFDFSGYSDMALGLGRAMGFHFPENFDYPLLSKSISEFWRRWHISLGTWFREYLYIPLGGNRVSRLKWLCNILIVWFCTGLWHGASWNFVVWGLYFGVALVLERMVYGRALERAPALLRHIYTLLVVTAGFVIFENESLSGGWQLLLRMSGFSGAPFAGAESLYYFRSYAVLLAAACLGATPLARDLALGLWRRLPRLVNVLQPVLAGLFLLLSTGYLIDSSFSPFLYFRF